MVENLLYSIVPVVSMMIGIYAGYKLRGDGGKDKLPDIKSPKRIIQEHREIAEEEKELEEIENWIKKINDYNGEFGE